MSTFIKSPTVIPWHYIVQNKDTIDVDEKFCQIIIGFLFLEYYDVTCIDLRRNQAVVPCTIVNNHLIEVVDSYKYLGTIINNKWNFTENTDRLCKMSQQRLYCLQKLVKFNIDRTLMTAFYKAYVESILTFSLICWFASSAKSASAAKYGGVKLPGLTDLFDIQVLKKVHHNIFDNFILDPPLGIFV